LVIQPFQQDLLHSENIRILACDDIYCNTDEVRQSIGYEPELDQIAGVPLVNVITEVSSNKILDDGYSHQPRMCGEGSSVLHPQDAGLLAMVDVGDRTLLSTPFPDQSYVSAFPNCTNSGVLRQHALRFNSSILCVASEKFPDQCPGELPFEVNREGSFVRHNGMSEHFHHRICVPGNYIASPWDLIRSRQDITEEIYLLFHDYFEPENGTSEDLLNFAMNHSYRCISNTTRGYFELPNLTLGTTIQLVLCRKNGRVSMKSV
jgi:hypothetical protein